MDHLTYQIRALADGVDEVTHNSILKALRDLQLSLETRQDTMNRIAYAHLEPSLVHVGIGLNVFNILTESEGPLTVDQLAERTGAAPTLLGRVLRYLASAGTIKETGRDTFTANNITTHLSNRGVQSAVYHNVETVGPAILALRGFLSETQYKNITDPSHTPLQKAFNITVPAFVWAATQPERAEQFNLHMQTQREGQPEWLDVFQLVERIQAGTDMSLEPDQVLFVDVGGGVGHQGVALRDRLPEAVKNRIVVQDVEMVIARAIQREGVEAMVHDFWEPQPVQGARYYYLRMIIHDYPDEKAVTLLQNIIPAQGPNSAILIDDLVLPETGVSLYAAQSDIVMMAALAAQERTRGQWEVLLQKAGLRIRGSYVYTTRNDTVLECVPA
ncbi:S-adenosyl-L-methionine-dependent methyltransferase [Aspergillus carlsbadensis]|nr:S-adenosyl-L-methionine-dependent methyltransferase [Aspergillus carlsbadensis]